MTAQDLVSGALRLIGVLAAGEAPSAEESADGLAALNQLVLSLSAEGLPLYEVAYASLPLNGAASVQLAKRPAKIKAAAVKSVGVQVRFAVVGAEEWADGGRNRVLWCDYGFPDATVHLRPVPTGGTLELYTYVHLEGFATLSAAVNLPPGYERALRLNLACDLAPEFGRPIEPSLYELAKAAKLAIAGLNANILGEPAPVVKTTEPQP